MTTTRETSAIRVGTTKARMKAIVQDSYGSADVLELRNIDIPVAGDDDVLVRVHAAGCGPDVWHIMTGMPYIARSAIGFRKPKAPVRGWDAAGTVEAVGANVTAFQPGDDVMGVAEGSFAELAIAPADKLVPKPANLTFQQAAAIPIAGSPPCGPSVRWEARTPAKRCSSSVRREALAPSPFRSRRRPERRSQACAARRRKTWCGLSARIT
jgi:D-arabinose 1-dehydrogenase-like Zn-dependent alcohol dehydrogenase